MTFLDECIQSESRRQNKNIELIASENFTSERIIDIVGSDLTNKYSEGYPEQDSINKFIERFPDYIHTGNIGRYYGGCENVDQIELYARYMFQKAFRTNYHVNVQPHSGSQANQAAYQAVLKPGDTILSMGLDIGGHLTHGSKVNFSGKLYNFINYTLDEDGYIDYTDIENKIKEYNPKLVVVGASAYSRTINFRKIKEICYKQEKAPLIMADIAHIAGLIVAGLHPTPFGYVDIITTTTHKTLRGPRGGLIFCKPELAKKIDSAVFPGSQGGPLMHVIAAKAACAEEACSDNFIEYQRNIIKNTAAMADEFKKLGYQLVTSGTDNHLFMLDLSKTHPDVSGLMVQEACDKEHITVNKNMVPNDPRGPKETSGVRIGCAAMTTKGYTEEDFRRIANRINEIINKL